MRLGIPKPPQSGVHEPSAEDESQGVATHYNPVPNDESVVIFWQQIVIVRRLILPWDIFCQKQFICCRKTFDYSWKLRLCHLANGKHL